MEKKDEEVEEMTMKMPMMTMMMMMMMVMMMMMMGPQFALSAVGLDVQHHPQGTETRVVA